MNVATICHVEWGTCLLGCCWIKSPVIRLSCQDDFSTPAPIFAVTFFRHPYSGYTRTVKRFPFSIHFNDTAVSGVKNISLYLPPNGKMFVKNDLVGIWIKWKSVLQSVQKNVVSNENNFECCDHIWNADWTIKFMLIRVKSFIVPHHDNHSYLFSICVTVHYPVWIILLVHLSHHAGVSFVDFSSDIPFLWMECWK